MYKYTNYIFVNLFFIIFCVWASQDNLRNQLSSLIKSKLDVATSTSAEIDRLRDIIRLLKDQILYLSDREPTIKVYGDVEVYKDEVNKYYIQLSIKI